MSINRVLRRAKTRDARRAAKVEQRSALRDLRNQLVDQLHMQEKLGYTDTDVMRGMSLGHG